MATARVLRMDRVIAGAVSALRPGRSVLVPYDERLLEIPVSAATVTHR